MEVDHRQFANELARREFVDNLVTIAEAAPIKIELPVNLTLEDFSHLLRAVETIHKKSAFWWGVIYQEAILRFGDEAYQLFSGSQYEVSTLKNYTRLTRQVDPELWEEPLPDRHFFAIGQNVQDFVEQKKWVDYAKESGVSADQLREEIHNYYGTPREAVEQAVWVACQHCGGHGGFLISEENNGA